VDIAHVKLAKQQLLKATVAVLTLAPWFKRKSTNFVYCRVNQGVKTFTDPEFKAVGCKNSKKSSYIVASPKEPRKA
jgi:hypothetical protein